jgi:hypothetical protein
MKDTGAVRDSVIVTDVALAVLFGVSAIYGYATVATCRQLRSQVVSPYQHGPIIQTRKQRQSEEADEEAAVQARQREKAAADATAAGEAAAARAPPRRRGTHRAMTSVCFASVWRKATVGALLVFGSPTLIGSCSFMSVQSARKDERGRLEPAGCTTSMTARRQTRSSRALCWS